MPTGSSVRSPTTTSRLTRLNCSLRRALLYDACLNAPSDLVRWLVGHGTDPNVLIEEVETLLVDGEFDRWYCEDNLGTAGSATTNGPVSRG